MCISIYSGNSFPFFSKTKFRYDRKTTKLHCLSIFTANLTLIKVNKFLHTLIVMPTIFTTIRTTSCIFSINPNPQTYTNKNKFWKKLLSNKLLSHIPKLGFLALDPFSNNIQYYQKVTNYKWCLNNDNNNVFIIIKVVSILLEQLIWNNRTQRLTGLQGRLSFKI